MPTVGEVLRTERERQGRTLKEISDALNIKRQYLAALEEDRYDDIPGVVFVKGFIRNYGNCLGMDGGALVDSGTHAQLLERCGVYREIYASQTGGNLNA